MTRPARLPDKEKRDTWLQHIVAYVSEFAPLSHWNIVYMRNTRLRSVDRRTSDVFRFLEEVFSKV